MGNLVGGERSSRGLVPGNAARVPLGLARMNQVIGDGIVGSLAGYHEKHCRVPRHGESPCDMPQCGIRRHCVGTRDAEPGRVKS